MPWVVKFLAQQYKLLRNTIRVKRATTLFPKNSIGGSIKLKKSIMI